MEKETIEQIKEAAAQKFEEKAESLKSDLTEKQKESLESLKNELLTDFNDKIENAVKAEDFEALKTEMNSKIDNIDKSVMELGKGQTNNQRINSKADFDVKLQKAIEQIGNYEDKALADKITIKAPIDTLNIHTVGDVPAGTLPDNGTVSALGETWRTRAAQIIGTFTKPRPFAKVMDYVNIRPLNADRLILFNLKVQGQFEVTPECDVKPVSYINLEDQTADAEAVASTFFTTTKMRRFYPNVVTDFVNTFEELLMEKIPDTVASAIQSAATAFTVVPEQQIYTAPNNFDVIAQIAASMKKLNFIPDTVFLSPYQYAAMITSKGTDGHYNLENGMSIVIMDDNTIRLGNLNLTVIEDETLGNDTVRVADLASSVFVGLDEQLIYFEVDGVTDDLLQAGGSNTVTGARRNIRTHVMEKFIATIIPDEMAGAIVETTFTQGKSLITA